MKIAAVQLLLTSLMAVLMAVACPLLAVPPEDEPFHYSRGFTQTRGGLDGGVIVVNTLDPSGPGSIREALDATGPRTIVFEVGGVIDLDGQTLAITNPHVSIAGQTAPEPGITFIRGDILVNTHDVIIQHIRTRPGDVGKTRHPWEPDGIATARSMHDIVFDHVTATWAVDENMSVNSPRASNNQPATGRVTFSNNLIAEALSQSTHGKGEHSKGSLIMDTAYDIALFGNFFLHNMARNPMMKVGSSVVVANNLIYNPGKQIIGVEGGPSHSAIVGNTAIDGPDTATNLMFPNRAELFVQDNWRQQTGDLAEVPPGAGQTLTEPPLWPANFTAIPAAQAHLSIPFRAGARPAERDPIDRRIVRTYLERNGRIIDSQEEVGGYPVAEPTYRALTLPAAGESIEQWLAPFTHEVVYGTEGAPPEGVSDVYAVLDGGSALLDVLRNDIKRDFSTFTHLELHSISQPSKGTAVIIDDRIRYTPDSGHVDQTDSLTYIVRDGELLSDPTTVTLHIVNEDSLYDGNDNGLPDGWELTHYGELQPDGHGDFDGDGVSDGLEFQLGRDAAGADRVRLAWEDDFAERDPGPLAASPEMWSIPAAGGPTGGVMIEPSGGGQMLEITSGGFDAAEIAQLYEEDSEWVIWTDFTATLATHGQGVPPPDFGSDVTAAFYLTHAGNIAAFNGSTGQWSTITLNPALDIDEPVRYTVRQDYREQHWSLWINGTRILQQYGFAHPRASAGGFRLRQERRRSSALESIRVTRSAPAGLETGTVGTYDDWQSGIHWNGADASPGADPNTNGLSNLQEYAFALPDPTAAAGGGLSFPLLEIGDDGDTFLFTYHRNRQAEDIEFSHSLSENLQDWTPYFPSPEHVSLLPIDLTGDGIFDADEVTIRIPTYGLRLFLRVGTRKY